MLLKLELESGESESADFLAGLPSLIRSIDKETVNEQ